MFTKVKAVKVQEVIMSGSSDRIGMIKYNNINDGKPMDTTRLSIAKPLFYNFSQYPTINEVVYILAGPKSNFTKKGDIQHYYLPPLNIYGAVNHNAQPTELTREELEKRSETGLDRYFQEIENIKPLQPYGGDIMIEGRYGNSIRFGSTTSGSIPNHWSNEGSAGNPITIIRNGQSGSDRGNTYEHILEDINDDDSSIYLCSNQQLNTFKKSGIEKTEIEVSYKHILK